MKPSERMMTDGIVVICMTIRILIPPANQENWVQVVSELHKHSRGQNERSIFLLDLLFEISKYHQIIHY
jgi:hypothetical protein